MTDETSVGKIGPDTPIGSDDRLIREIDRLRGSKVTLTWR